MAPVLGRHRVIDRPESVSRVAPPMTTMATTKAAVRNSQMATERERSAFRNEVIAAWAAPRKRAFLRPQAWPCPYLGKLYPSPHRLKTAFLAAPGHDTGIYW